MKIEVGDYIRDIYSRIGKIKSYSNGTYFTEKFGASSGEIVKHSKNIIDLIEVGDYVNGVLIVYIDKKEDEICTPEKIYKLSESKIERIVTKEQFESVEYKVGDE